MRRRLLTKLTALAASAVLLVSGLDIPTLASEVVQEATGEDLSAEYSTVVVDPLYANELTGEELEELEASLQVSAFALERAAEQCATLKDAADYVRKQMVARETTVVFQVPTSIVSSNGGSKAFVEKVAEDAVAYSDSCSGQEGDALKWGRAGYGGIAKDEGTGQTKVTFTFEYRSTAAQEQDLTATVNTVIAGLELSVKSDYEKVRAIHDWICNNVDYEYDKENKARYSAYSAACKGKAVCQGYAVLFYRMCKEAKLPVRIIGGLGNGGPHGWNIVWLSEKKSRAAGAWYNVDCTWDGQTSLTKHTYFLKSDSEFPGHERYAEYNIPELATATTSYPIDGTEGWNLVPVWYKEEIIEKPYPHAVLVTTSKGGQLSVLDSESDYYASKDTSGKNKIYMFLQSTCPRSQSLANDLNKNISRFEDTNIYIISTLEDPRYADDKDIRDFKNKIASPNPKLNFMYNGQPLQNDWLNYTIAPAGKGIEGNTPIVIYVDKNNKIQYMTFDSSSAAAVRTNLDRYCSSDVSTVAMYNITYHLDGGINDADNPVSYLEETGDITLWPAKKDGYAFKGWYSDAGLKTKVDKITSTDKSNLELYAKWEKNPTITYVMNGGANHPENPTSYMKGENTIDLKEPTYEGYTFLGWYSDAKFTTKITQIKTTAETGNITIYAKWGKVCTITYVLDGGTNNSDNPGSYTEGGTSFTLLAPKKLGYTFVGWYMGSAEGEEIKGSTTALSGNLTLYAKWEKNTGAPEGFPEIDMTITAGNILMGIEGTYVTDTAENILAKLNKIREDACTEGIKDSNGKTLTSKDYVPLQWSSAMEAIARIRAAEIAVRLDSDHTRPNGKNWNTAWTKTKSYSMGENLALTGGGIVTAIEMWESEKTAWIKGDRSPATGHYANLINFDYKYVAVGAFQLSDGSLAVTQEFSNLDGLDGAKSEAKGFCLQDVEIAASAVAGLAFDAQSPLEMDAEGSKDVVLNATVTYKAGDKIQNGTILAGRNITGPVHKGATWTSSDETVATVDENGKITAKKNGETTITAKVGDKSATLNVVVREVKPSTPPVPTATPSPTPASSTQPASTASPSPTPASSTQPASTATPSPTPASSATPVPTATPSPAPEPSEAPNPTAVPSPTPGPAATQQPGKWVEEENGGKYWYEDGVKQGTEGRGKEIFDPESGEWYWLDAENGGQIAVSKDVYQADSVAGDWAEDEEGTGKWVRYDENGHMVKGWDTNEKGTYYFDQTFGTMAKGYVTIEGSVYFFDKVDGTGTGKPCRQEDVNGWVTAEDGKRCWYESGVAQGKTGRGKEIYDPETNAWYWLDSVDGGKKAVAKDVYQEFSVAGTWAEKADGTGKWVRYDRKGHMVKGWDTNDNGTYYFDLVFGTMAKGKVTIEGKDYEFDRVTGILLTK